jgi:hypothetical protein
MTVMLSPQQMAEVYFRKQHFSAIGALHQRMKEAEPESATYRYWKEVLGIVEARAKRMKSYRAGKPAKQEGEKHV